MFSIKLLSSVDVLINALLNLHIGTVEGKSKWYHQVFQGNFHLKRQAVPLNLTWVDLAFSCTKSYPGQVKWHSLPFQVEAVLKYLVVTGTTYFCPRLYMSGK